MTPAGGGDGSHAECDSILCDGADEAPACSGYGASAHQCYDRMMDGGGDQELATAVAATQVQEVHARSVRRRVVDFMEYVGDQLMEKGAGLQQIVGESVTQRVARWLMAYGTHLIRTHPGITRSTTVRTYLTEAARPWPSALKEGNVRAFIEGCEFLNPTAPVVADVPLQRELEWDKVDEGLLAMEKAGMWHWALMSTGLVCGLRLRETARMMTRRADFFKVGPPEGRVEFREKGEAKANMKGRRLTAPQYGWIPPKVANALRQTPLPWRIGEQELLAECRMVAMWWKARGVVTDVRTFRRAAARDLREHLAAAGRTETEALATVRDALGHRPGTQSVFGYVGAHLSRTGETAMAAAQMQVAAVRRARPST